jgi:hypothetical protein
MPSEPVKTAVTIVPSNGVGACDEKLTERGKNGAVSSQSGAVYSQYGAVLAQNSTF